MGGRACFCSFMLKAGSRRRKRSNISTSEFVFVCHTFHSNLFLIGSHGREGKNRRAGLVFKSSLYRDNKKRANPLFNWKKAAEIFPLPTPSFVCNGVLKSYFMSVLTDICSALNNMNYILRYKLLILLDFVL